MHRHSRTAALAVAAALLGAGAVAYAHTGTGGGTPIGDLSFADPAPTGLGYEWTVKMHRKQTAQMVYAVGAKSWSEPSNPEGQKGWTHTSNWIALELEQAARVTIKVERQQGVVVTSGSNTSAARFALVPAVSLYSGWDDTTEQETHTFNNVGNFWSTVVYRGHAANPKAKGAVVYKAKLPAGRYSIVVGGNPKSLGDPAAYPSNSCDPAGTLCNEYTGLHGYKLTITTR
jgi:hypothetical protein